MNSLLPSPFRFFRTKATAQRVKALRQVQIRQRPGMIQSTRLSLQQRQVVAVIEENPFLAPAPWMLSHHLILVAQNHPVHVAFDQDFMVGIGDRHRVVVVIEPDQG